MNEALGVAMTPYPTFSSNNLVKDSKHKRTDSKDISYRYGLCVCVCVYRIGNDCVCVYHIGNHIILAIDIHTYMLQTLSREDSLRPWRLILV